jgi:hypothetical protein
MSKLENVRSLDSKPKQSYRIHHCWDWIFATKPLTVRNSFWNSAGQEIVSQVLEAAACTHNSRFRRHGMDTRFAASWFRIEPWLRYGIGVPRIWARFCRISQYLDLKSTRTIKFSALRDTLTNLLRKDIKLSTVLGASGCWVYKGSLHFLISVAGSTKRAGFWISFRALSELNGSNTVLDHPDIIFRELSAYYPSLPNSRCTAIEQRMLHPHAMPFHSNPLNCRFMSVLLIELLNTRTKLGTREVFMSVCQSHDRSIWLPNL